MRLVDHLYTRSEVKISKGLGGVATSAFIDCVASVCIWLH